MLIFVLFIIEILLIFLAFYLMGYDLFRPSVVFLSVFALSTFFALLNVFNWRIDYLPKTLTIMVTGFLLAIVADYLVYLFHSRSIGRSQELQVLVIEKWKVFVILLVQLAALFLYYKEIKRLAVISGYVEGANLLWHFRNATSYTAEASISGLVSLFVKTSDAIGYVFTFVFIQNTLSKKIKLRSYYFYLFPIVLFAIRVLMGSGRQELLRWVAFSVVISYILLHYRSGWSTKKLSFRYMKKIVVILPITLGLFYVAANVIGRETTRTFFQYISTYAGGSIQHFNQYLTERPLVVEKHFGAETFPAVYSFLHRLGVTHYTRSVHLEMRQLGITQGNIYTFFRRPYHDFGLLGMCLMVFFVLLLFSLWYSSFKKKTLGPRTNYSMICYSYLFYWIVLASIENYAIGLISLGTVMTLLLIKLVYFFLFGFSLKRWRPHIGHFDPLEKESSILK